MDNINPQRGDRSTLNRDQLELLETQILPTARRWLNNPALCEHGMKTLEFWGEGFECRKAGVL